MTRNLHSLSKILAAFTVVFFPTILAAQDIGQSGMVQIESSWARASVGTMRPTAAYLKLHNNGSQTIVLKAIRSEIAGQISMHQTAVNAEGISTMRPVKNLQIRPGETFDFEPGSFHVMLMEIQQPLVRGESMPLTLIFGDASEKTIEVPILSIGARNRGDE